CMVLVPRHLHAGGPEAQGDLGDPGGEGLDEVDGFPLDDLDHCPRYGRVISGVTELVGARGLPGIEVEHEVRVERLPLLALAGENTVIPVPADSDQPDFIVVAHGPSSFSHSSPSWSPLPPK